MLGLRAGQVARGVLWLTRGVLWLGQLTLGQLARAIEVLEAQRDVALVLGAPAALGVGRRLDRPVDAVAGGELLAARIEQRGRERQLDMAHLWPARLGEGGEGLDEGALQGSKARKGRCFWQKNSFF